MLLRQVQLWIIPVIVAGVGISGVNLALADTTPPPSRLEQYLQDVQLIPHSEAVENYQQVYYLFGKQKVFVTSDNMNHTNPISSGRYIVWLGSSNDVTSQVYLYDVLTNTTLQLSGLSTNTYPDMDGNHVVWQQWVDNGWQVMYYDGLQVIQISSGASSFRPRILGDMIVYVTYDANDVNHAPWHIIQYDTLTGQSSLVSATDKTTQTWPHFSNKGELKNKYDLDYLSN
jgi:hypothetical protein